MFYFAYGSNMSISRLRARVPSAQRLGACVLRNHDLRFHKHGADGSGKCDAFKTGNCEDYVLGSLFRIDPFEKSYLDAAEGLGHGYDEKTVSLTRESGEQVSAYTYYALKIDHTLKPYSWYLQHVLIGARESSCPAGYVSRIASVATIEDVDAQRAARERAIHE